jgi:YD repeat-containing protein
MRARLKRASDRRTLIAPHARAGGRLLMLLLLLSAAAQSALAMPPGWTKGCIRPIYGSADGACATTLEIPGSFFTVDPVLGSCNYFSSNGAPTSQQSICMACPTGFAIDAQRNCSPQPGFAAADPYANAGSQVQPALSAAGTASDPIFVANPVNANTGNKYQREVDYEGVGPFPLMFVRHYNSQFIYQSQLGLSWRHHYDRQLLIVDATHVVVVRPNGQAFEFVLSGGVWTSAIDIVDRLQNIAGGWRLVTQADETETYDASGRLLSIADRTGLTQTLTYSTALTPPSIATKAGLLIAVTDPLGRQLKLTYDLRFLVKTLTDPAGNVFQYGYNRQTSLTTVISPGTPSATRTYVYQFAGINPVLANTLTSIVDENGQTYASFTYDVTTARTTGSTLGGTLAADPYTIKYNNNGTTSVTDARITRVYSFTILRGIPRVTGLDQPCSCVRLELRVSHLRQQRVRSHEHRFQRQCDSLPAQRSARSRGSGNIAHRSLGQTRSTHHHHGMGRSVSPAASHRRAVAHHHIRIRRTGQSADAYAAGNHRHQRRARLGRFAHRNTTHVDVLVYLFSNGSRPGHRAHDRWPTHRCGGPHELRLGQHRQSILRHQCAGTDDHPRRL